MEYLTTSQVRKIFQPEERDRDGNPKNTIASFTKIMENDRRYSGVRFNELTGRGEIHIVRDGSPAVVPWTDADEAQSMQYCESAFGLYSKEKHLAAPSH